MTYPNLEIPDTEDDIKEAIKIGHKHGLQNAEQAPNVIYILRMLSDQYSDLQKRYSEVSHSLIALESQGKVPYD